MHGSAKEATVPCVVSVLRCEVNISTLLHGGLAQMNAVLGKLHRDVRDDEVFGVDCGDGGVNGEGGSCSSLRCKTCQKSIIILTKLAKKTPELLTRQRRLIKSTSCSAACLRNCVKCVFVVPQSINLAREKQNKPCSVE